MSDAALMITDMSILVGIFALGFVAKMFPKKQSAAGIRRKTEARD